MRLHRQWTPIVLCTLLFAQAVSAENSTPMPHQFWIKKGVLQEVLGIPSTMADVKGGYFPPGHSFLDYVLIEDVHTLPEAQGKIAAVLLYAHHHWGSRVAYVEGAFGPVGPPPFPIFTPDRGERSASELLQLGLFSGGELAAALAFHSRTGGPFEVIGMEDPVLYQRQLEVLEALAQLEKQALAHLALLSKDLGPTDTRRLRRLIERRQCPRDYSMDRQTPRPPLSDPLLRRAVRLADNYYALTQQRSRHFVLRTQTRIGRAPSLLVMGGFHTAEIARLLRGRGVSFVVLSPHLTETQNRVRYEESLLKSLETLRKFPIHPLSSPSVDFLQLGRLRKPAATRTN